MAHYASRPDRRPAPPPEVDRPSGETWGALQAEGIRWEGQALIVGVDKDLPVRLILTSERLAFIANGEIALDIPRDWLRPQPKLAAVNGVHLFVTPDGARPGSDETQQMLLRARAGRGAAAQLVAVVTGRPLPIEHQGQAPHIVAELPAWKTTVGAAAPMALPPLPDAEDAPEPAGSSAAWPPVEQQGIAARPRAARPERPGQPTSIAAWADRNLAPDPDPVPMAVSRSARRQGTLADGVTVADETVAGPTPRQEPRGGRRGVVWALRAAIIVILVGTAAWFGRDRLVIDADTIRERLPADVQRTLGIADDEPEMAENPDGASQVGSAAGTDAVDGDGTEGATNSGQTAAEAAAAMQTEEALGIGGTTSPLPPTDGADGADGAGGQTGVPEDPTASHSEGITEIPAEEPTVPPTAAPTEAPHPTEAPVVPTEEPVPTEAPVVPTEAPVIEPTIAPTEAPLPTEEPTTAPTTPPTPAPTVAPTEAPTATAEPSATATEDATETPAVEGTQAPAPTATIEPQVPSVAPETTPEQAVVANGFRYTIEGASVGETVPELPQVNSVGGYGEWVVLSVYGQNVTGTEQVFDMSSFRLYADGQEVLVDVGNGWVNGLVGNTPAYGNTDAILWAAGEGHRFVLTFLAPPGAQSLVLQAGEQQIDLTPALENPTPLMSDEATPAASALIRGTVIEVIDAETILVDIDGTQVTVRYLGVDAPDECYASEATAANNSLVAGKTVTLERQATDIDARGNWVRDVWTENDAGQPVLVSQALVAQGAATADISVPNTRFAGWLTQAEAEAQASGAGVWGACGEGAAVVPAPATTAFVRHDADRVSL